MPATTAPPPDAASSAHCCMGLPKTEQTSLKLFANGLHTGQTSLVLSSGSSISEELVALLALATSVDSFKARKARWQRPQRAMRLLFAPNRFMPSTTAPCPFTASSMHCATVLPRTEQASLNFAFSGLQTGQISFLLEALATEELASCVSFASVLLALLAETLAGAESLLTLLALEELPPWLTLAAEGKSSSTCCLKGACVGAGVVVVLPNNRSNGQRGVFGESPAASAGTLVFRCSNIRPG
mmetsp:Transcript_124575/g.387900  ORF Transcript_124575/g.387900 Transcript_124575/m.387900 type:complete len:242 (-) Transcript_124575:207-932(-)